MAGAHWFVVIGYAGGAVARIPCGSEQEAIQGLKYLAEAGRTPAPQGTSPFVNITTNAMALARDFVFAYAYAVTDD